MKILLVASLASCLTAWAQSGVDLYSAKELQSMTAQLTKKAAQFSSRDLARYGNHYLLLASRETTGSAEIHEHEADIFVVESGAATIVVGGKIPSPHIQKAGELRGASIIGGERFPLAAGDIIHIPAGTPHQLLIEKGNPFTYFVVKVMGQ